MSWPLTVGDKVLPSRGQDEYTVVRLDPIEGSNCQAFLAYGDLSGKWFAGRVDTRAPAPYQHRADQDAKIWETKEIALQDHFERMNGEIW